MVDISYNEFVEMISALEQQIEDYILENNIDRKKVCLVPVPRGGYVATIYLSHKMNVKMISSLFSFIPGEDYSHIIIVEDCVDTGKTMRYPHYIRGRKYGAKVAALVAKTWTPEDCMPEFYAMTTDQWVVFPWETKESE